MRGDAADAHRASAEKRSHEMADAFDAEATRTRNAIEELDASVSALQQTQAEECFYSFSTSPTEARARIKDVSERTTELLRTMEVRDNTFRKYETIFAQNPVLQSEEKPCPYSTNKHFAKLQPC